MTKEEAFGRVRTDFAAMLGRVVLVRELTGYRGDDSIDFNLATPAKVRITATPDSDLCRMVDREWVDPYWNLELVEPHPELEGVRSLWMFGTSYFLKGIDPARFEELPSPAPAGA